MNDLVNTGPNAVGAAMSPQELTEYYRQMAEGYAATERRAGSTISVKNGIMSVSDQPIPGNQFAAIILDAVRLNTFYTQAYNPQSMDPPVCYAVGRTDDELHPHPDMAKHQYFQPQSNSCLDCPHNQFGSGRTGTGKACTNRRRLYMLLAGTYGMTQQGLQLNPYTEPSHYETTPFLQMTLPPTTLKGWGEYVRASAAQYQRPFFGLVTRVYLYPHPTHGKEAIGFEALGAIPDEWATTVIPRQQQAMKEIFEGYEPPQQRHPQGGFHQQQQMHQG